MSTSSSIAVGERFATPSVGEAVIQAFGWKPHQVKIEAVEPGFSGALIWKVTPGEAVFALKRWPHSDYFPLEAMVRMAQSAHAAGLRLVPNWLQTMAGHYHAVIDGHRWTASSWMPGKPTAQPTEQQLRHAIEALSRLHAVWKAALPIQLAPCHAVERQYQRLSEWTQEELARLTALTRDQPLYARAYHFLTQFREWALKLLEPWLHRAVAQHWCIVDLWSDHVLFTDAEVTGIIDFGTARVDHPAQDLARLLGSYTQGDAIQRAQALNHYRPFSDELAALVTVLDDAGTVVGLSNWLRWLVLNPMPEVNVVRTHGRLLALVERLERRHYSHD